MNHKTTAGKFGTVHYWTTGAGAQCILFTHGATMDHGLFQHQIEFFAKNYQVIVWDVPAHGLSRPCKEFSLQNAANELVGILDAEQIEAAHLVGQSMGGYIIQYVARDYPERVSSLTAVDSSPLQPAYYSPLDNWLLSITPPLLRLFPYQMLIKTIAKQIAIDEKAQTYALETLQGLTKDEIANIMDKVYRGVQAYRYGEALPVSILVIFGEGDRTGKVKTYSKQWAEREKRPLKIIPNAAHNANMDNPNEFNRLLAEFLSTI